jgi:hypothetical protein
VSDHTDFNSDQFPLSESTWKFARKAGKDRLSDLESLRFWADLLGDNHDEQCFAFGGKVAERTDSAAVHGRRARHSAARRRPSEHLLRRRSAIPFATHTIFIARMIEALISGTASLSVQWSSK